MPNNSNGFITGFTLGMVAGACGFYLYATKDGAKVRRQIREEFEQAYATIPESEKQAYPDTLRGAIKHFFESIWVDSDLNQQDSSSKPRVANRPKQNTSAKTATKSPKFKNTK